MGLDGSLAGGPSWGRRRLETPKQGDEAEFRFGVTADSLSFATKSGRRRAARGDDGSSVSLLPGPGVGEGGLSARLLASQSDKLERHPARRCGCVASLAVGHVQTLSLLPLFCALFRVERLASWRFAVMGHRPG